MHSVLCSIQIPNSNSTEQASNIRRMGFIRNEYRVFYTDIQTARIVCKVFEAIAAMKTQTKHVKKMPMWDQMETVIECHILLFL